MSQNNEFFYFCRAVCNLSKGAKYTISDSQIISWESLDIPQPSNEAIAEEIIKLKQVDANSAYQRERVKEYPTLQEQLDMQYWDSVNGTTVWQDTINAIKAKYPKVG